MKSHFKMFAGCVLALGLVSPAFAGPGRGGGHGEHGPKLHKLVEKLNLDEATAAQVKAKFEAGKAESKALREQIHGARQGMHAQLEADNPDRAAIMAKVEEIGALKVKLEKQRMNTMLDVRALLNPEQRAQLKALHEGRRGKHGKMRGRHRRGGGEGPPDGPPSDVDDDE